MFKIDFVFAKLSFPKNRRKAFDVYYCKKQKNDALHNNDYSFNLKKDCSPTPS